MNSKLVSTFICALMVANIFTVLLQNAGQPDTNGITKTEESIIPYEKDGYEYANEESKLKVYLDESSVGEGVKVGVGDHWAVWRWKEMSFIDDMNEIKTIKTVSSVEGIIEDNTMTYEGTYPFTTEVFSVFENKLKHEIILSQFHYTSSNFGNIEYLSYIGILELSYELSMYVDGIKQKGDFITSSSIGFVDENGIELFHIPAPYAYEKDNEEERIDCQYEVKLTNGRIMFHISTPYEWLSDIARNYPLVIDPTFVALYEPVADAGPDQIGYVNDTIYFDGSASHDVDGDIVSYEWDFGDGSPLSSGETTSHVYNPNAIYTVTLTVTDNDGLTGTDTTIMYISNSIQDLIDAANPGDTVNVPADLYWERIIIDKPLTLIGADKNTTIIDGWGLYGDEGITVTIESSEVTIQGFTITNGSYGVYTPSSWPPPEYNNLVITDNIVKSNNRNGIALVDAIDLIISNNIIELNNYGGIRIQPNYFGILNNTITNNVITSNGDFGIRIDGWINDPANSSICDNTITDNGDYGIVLRYVSYFEIKNNSIVDNRDGIRLEGSNNTLDSNQIINNSNRGIQLGGYDCPSRDNHIINNNISNNYRGFQIFAYYSHKPAIDNIMRFNTFAYNQYGAFIGYPGGLEGQYATRNKIYLNNFIENT
ncbi:MAG: right-handed parallel beta-helix repeat-containing protein, partial [Thermoplasmata archaeon]